MMRGKSPRSNVEITTKKVKDIVYKAIAMMCRKSTSSENIYLKKNNNNNYQSNSSKLGRGKGFIPPF